MLLRNICILSIWCAVAFICIAHAAEESPHQKGAVTMKKDTVSPPASDSTIYKIERSDGKVSAPRPPRKEQPKSLEAAAALDAPDPHKSQPMSKGRKVKNLGKNAHSHGQNKKLLSKLGFTKVKAPNSHNRKRLAIESRRHASADDSHMFIIKLPPNFYYYSDPMAALSSAKGNGKGNANANNNGKASEQGQLNSKNALMQHTVTAANELEQANGKKVSFPFSSNGKPARIYHWNLPIIKKILEDKQRFPHFADTVKDQLIDIKDIPTWSKPWENETLEKSYGKSHMMHNYKKSLKHKSQSSPSYYAPANAVNKHSFNKYFAGNGKPKGFYVIKANEKKPLYYKNITA